MASRYNRSFLEVPDDKKEETIRWLKAGGMNHHNIGNGTSMYLYWEVWQAKHARFIVDKTSWGVTIWKNGYDSFDEAMSEYKQALENNAVGMAKRAFGLD